MMLNWRLGAASRGDKWAQGHKETSYSESIVVIQVKGCVCPGDGGVNCGCSKGGYKKSLDSGFIWKVETPGFPDRPSVRGKSQRQCHGF